MRYPWLCRNYVLQPLILSEGVHAVQYRLGFDAGSVGLYRLVEQCGALIPQCNVDCRVCHDACPVFVWLDVTSKCVQHPYEIHVAGEERAGPTNNGAGTARVAGRLQDTTQPEPLT